MTTPPTGARTFTAAEMWAMAERADDAENGSGEYADTAAMLRQAAADAERFRAFKSEVIQRWGAVEYQLVYARAMARLEKERTA